MNIKLFVLAMTFVLVTGCVTQRIYEGEKRSSEEVSVILPFMATSLFSTFPFRWEDPVHILRVDETYLSMTGAMIAEVLPGKHTIYVGLYYDHGFMFLGYTNNSTITFDTEAGKKYIVDYRSKDDSYFITEKESGKVIYDQAVPYPHRTGQMKKKTPTESPDIVSDSVSGERVSVYDYYGKAEEEVNSKSYDKYLWAKAFDEAEGDEQKRVTKYIELRAKQLYYCEKVGSISKSNLNEQPVPVAGALNNDISGTYDSDIRGGLASQFSDRKLMITFKQNGNNIIGTNKSQRKVLTGTQKDDTIKFEYFGRWSIITGEWKTNPDGIKLGGIWSTTNQNGIWNLTKIE